jgi:predicted nucleic acid-binding protein
VDVEEIATCLPIIQEVLQGFRDPRAFRIAREAMLAFPVVESPMTQQVFEQAIELYRSARRGGFTIRSGVDCLIAACALRNELIVLHHDRDFELLTRVSALTAKDVLR